ncbi:substrate-binding domain-containing protein [Paracoccus liaowanqingii]|uniref:substrate-binding domain-containing protein n=1 Tax=Paracoccus liaowanqingii TaxID=2560053 RepID=UPI001E3BC331|nr:substrate-binding domain-containing protein [Paracoccus liaowanqingii]
MAAGHKGSRPAATTSAAGKRRRSALHEQVVTPIIAAQGPAHEDTGLALGTQLLTGADPPDGVFCIIDLLAFGVMDAAHHRFGQRVPQNLSVIGFDDIPKFGWEA